MSFSSIPILDMSLAEDPATKPAFLNDLRHALLEVGFLYIKNFGIGDELIQQVIKECIAFFDLPMQEKLKIEMKNGKLRPLVAFLNNPTKKKKKKSLISALL
jgi:isopenicillin N synthase-like dioxygenase